MSFRETLGAQHRACDARLVEAERAVQRGDWAAATQRAQRFVDDTEAHFGFEELTLFPALAEAQPGAAAPIDVMRSEHKQLRELFAQFRDALDQRDANGVAEAVDIILLLLQQHNAKEENVLYPIADQVLSHERLIGKGLEKEQM
ncbi:MAG: hemerythrin domain-containing protein [Chromatiaceae bacterium]|nr:hemerythrin domain-containing protein [Gammaproteobacteria bacterium]MCP5305947.1 hemerythrin domain-containing protein [Chromatiaceae bacterium]MCP5312807.1 hemerythrin domain-containing protein [Chromatiaceae bacterium]